MPSIQCAVVKKNNPFLFCGLSLCLNDGVLGRANPFQFHEVSFTESMCCANGILLEGLLLFHWAQGSSPLCLPSGSVIWFYVEVFDTFGVEFSAAWVVCVCLEFSTCSYPGPFVDHAVFLPERISGCFIKYQVSTGLWVYICIFDSIPLIISWLFMPMPCRFYYCSSLVKPEIGANIQKFFFSGFV